jgi:hypothetical protein
MIFKVKILFAAFMLILVLGTGHAEEKTFDPVNSPDNVRLDFRLEKYKSVYVRLGSAGTTIDKINFLVDFPTFSEIAGDQTLELFISASILDDESIQIVADSSSPMTDGITEIPMNKVRIYSTGGGSFGSVDTYFDGSANQVIWTGAGAGDRNDTMSFGFTNDIADVPAGVYSGTIRFTVSATL